MGKDGQPKHRQAARELLRRKAQRQPAERLLIVCEGAKTEPLYLGEIRLRVHAAGYTKGQGCHWAVTRERLDVATARAEALLAAGHTAKDGTQPYTNMHDLLRRLLHLKDRAA